MGDRKKIRFIANPRSGANRRRNLPGLIEAQLDHDIYDAEIRHTEYAGHAVELAKESVDKGDYMVVACGGDGSVNEISSQLIRSNTILGVLPCGSGNGFAMHIGVGRNVSRAIRFLNDGQVITIDSCRMNDKTFLNLAGIGFDGAIAKHLHTSPIRGFLGYARYSLEEAFRYKMVPMAIQLDGEKLERTCMLVEVANAPIYGYGFTIVPHANFKDGKLEVLVANEAPKWRYLLECWRFLNRSFHKSSLVECYTAKEVIVTPLKKTAVHVDGEGFDLVGEARFSIEPGTVRVMVPRAHAGILRGVE
ncbi:MAG: YegS/Rv2252/BmrU family lipid kinase [Lewinellaceae bacterium]|nr:YegS/Rv2252/BmrU family lipid kinase [Lewinellaceae bacterium]